MCLEVIDVPGAVLRVSVSPSALGSRLAEQFVLRPAPEVVPGECEKVINIIAGPEVLHLHGPHGDFIADTRKPDKLYFAGEIDKKSAFAGSYSGWRSAPGGAVMALLDAEFVRQLFAASTAAALLHGAWLRKPGAPREVLLLGPSGAGKSTLAQRATEANWSLVADDTIALMQDGALVPFPRRSLKDGLPMAYSYSDPTPTSAALTALVIDPIDRGTAGGRLGAADVLAALEGAVLNSRASVTPAMMQILARTRFMRLPRNGDTPRETWKRAEQMIAACTC